MEIYPSNPSRNNGSIKLKIDKLQTEAGTIKEFIELPALTLAAPEGKSQIDLVMNRGSMEIQAMELKGGDLTIDMGGKVYFTQRVRNFRFNIRGKLGLGPKIIEAIPLIASMKKYKGEDGLYPVSVTGQMHRPNIRIGKFRVPL